MTYPSQGHRPSNVAMMRASCTASRATSIESRSRSSFTRSRTSVSGRSVVVMGPSFGVSVLTVGGMVEGDLGLRRALESQHLDLRVEVVASSIDRGEVAPRHLPSLGSPATRRPTTGGVR
jgi:hypothetical protein